jgi:hypothetical protein
MEMVNLNLAHRWYLGYDLDEPVPDHSSLNKIRERCGLFERVDEYHRTKHYQRKIRKRGV